MPILSTEQAQSLIDLTKQLNSTTNVDDAALINDLLSAILDNTEANNAVRAILGDAVFRGDVTFIQGLPGVDSTEPGPPGSPDTGADIIEKIHGLLKIAHVNGLAGKLTELTKAVAATTKKIAAVPPLDTGAQIVEKIKGLLKIEHIAGLGTIIKDLQKSNTGITNSISQLERKNKQFSIFLSNSSGNNGSDTPAATSGVTEARLAQVLEPINTNLAEKATAITKAKSDIAANTSAISLLEGTVSEHVGEIQLNYRDILEIREEQTVQDGRLDALEARPVGGGGDVTAEDFETVTHTTDFSSSNQALPAPANTGTITNIGTPISVPLQPKHAGNTSHVALTYYLKNTGDAGFLPVYSIRATGAIKQTRTVLQGGRVTSIFEIPTETALTGTETATFQLRYSKNGDAGSTTTNFDLHWLEATQATVGRLKGAIDQAIDDRTGGRLADLETGQITQDGKIEENKSLIQTIMGSLTEIRQTITNFGELVQAIKLITDLFVRSEENVTDYNYDTGFGATIDSTPTTVTGGSTFEDFTVDNDWLVVSGGTTEGVICGVGSFLDSVTGIESDTDGSFSKLLAKIVNNRLQLVTIIPAITGSTTTSRENIYEPNHVEDSRFQFNQQWSVSYPATAGVIDVRYAITDNGNPKDPVTVQLGSGANATVDVTIFNEQGLPVHLQVTRRASDIELQVTIPQNLSDFQQAFLGGKFVTVGLSHEVTTTIPSTPEMFEYVDVSAVPENPTIALGLSKTNGTIKFVYDVGSGTHVHDTNMPSKFITTLIYSCLGWNGYRNDFVSDNTDENVELDYMTQIVGQAQRFGTSDPYAGYRTASDHKQITLSTTATLETGNADNGLLQIVELPDTDNDNRTATIDWTKGSYFILQTNSTTTSLFNTNLVNGKTIIVRIDRLASGGENLFFVDSKGTSLTSDEIAHLGSVPTLERIPDSTPIKYIEITIKNINGVLFTSNQRTI